MTLTLRSEQIQQIRSHAERTYPEECCGILLGTIRRQADTAQKQLVTVIEVVNAWSETVAAELQEGLAIAPSKHSIARRDRYWIDPQDLLRAQSYARSQELDIVGIYHSHPDHPAIPSEMDRVLAWAEYAYVIISVEQGVATDIRCWQLDPQHQFQAEEFIVQPNAHCQENLP